MEKGSEKSQSGSSSTSESVPPAGLMEHLPMADKPPTLQIFSLLLCLGLTCFTGVQVYLTLQEYLEGQTMLSGRNDQTAKFPDLVFCSNVPLSYTSMDHSYDSIASVMGSLLNDIKAAFATLNIPKSRSLTAVNSGANLTNTSINPTVSGAIASVTSGANLTNTSINPTVSGAIASLGSVTQDMVWAMMHTLGRHFLKRAFGIWSETLLFSCELSNGTDCNNQAHFEQVDSELYLNCYRFLPDPSETSATFVLFSESLIGSSDLNGRFDQGFPLSAVSVTGKLQFDRSSGVALYVKPKEHYLHEDFKVMVSSGQSSLLTYTEHTDSAISKESNPCTKEGLKVRYNIVKQVSNAINISSATAEYKSEWQEFDAIKTDCILRARMDFLQQRCNCRDPALPMDEQRFRLPNCMNASTPEFQNTSSCFKGTNYVNVSTSHCYEPCQKRYYDVKVSGTKWPLETNIQAMVSNMLPVRLRSVQMQTGMRIAGLQYIVDLNNLISNNGTGINITQLSLLSKLSGIIGSNFVKLEVRQASDKVQASEESYKYNLMSLMGNLGGLVGLYLGWSAVSVIELLQSGYLLLKFTRMRLAALAFRRRRPAIKLPKSTAEAKPPSEQMDVRECW